MHASHSTAVATDTSSRYAEVRHRTDSQDSEASLKPTIVDCGTDIDDWSDASASSQAKTIADVGIQAGEPYSRRDVDKSAKSSPPRNGRSSPTPSASSYRKSVSFDLGDSDSNNTVASHRSTSQEVFANDNYEIPVPDNQQQPTHKPYQRKGILRSPSPMSSSTLDRPPVAPTPIQPGGVRREKVLSDDEIERENPFRREFFNEDDEPTQNIYEEIGFDKEPPVKECSDSETDRVYRNIILSRPKSNCGTETSSVFQSSADNYRYHSNEHLLDAEVKKIPIKWPVHKSTGDLSARPKEGPPLPPKPKVKTAPIIYNHGLKTFQQEMQRGDLVELEHNPVTNTVSAVPKTLEPLEFNLDTPLPPIPQSPSKRPTTTRPNESPPPPPVNLATMPSRNKIHRIDADPNIVTIVPTKICELPTPLAVLNRHENSAENILVSEATHRELLLHENQLRNTLITDGVIPQPADCESSAKVSVPVRHAPPPPVPNKVPSIPRAQPAPQILPVQYSHLPMPQHPGYFHAPTFSSTSPPGVPTSFGIIPTPAAAAASLMLPTPSSSANYLVSSDPNAAHPFAFPSHAFQHTHYTAQTPMQPSPNQFQSNYSNLATSAPALNWTAQNYYQQQLQFEYEQHQQQHLMHQFQHPTHRAYLPQSFSTASLLSPPHSSLSSSVMSVNSFSSTNHRAFSASNCQSDGNLYDVPCHGHEERSNVSVSSDESVRDSRLSRSGSVVGKETVV